MITLEKVTQSLIGGIMMKFNLKEKMKNAKFSFFAAFLCDELKKEKSDWELFLKLLPANFDEFSLNYSNEDLKWLEGSPCIESLRKKNKEIESDYLTICANIKEFATEHSLKSFKYAYLACMSRCFSTEKIDFKNHAMIPYCDLFNHSFDA